MRHLLLLVTAVLVSSAVYAQVSISVGVNVDRQPAWGPSGYDHVDYYYLPDIGVYYNVPRHLFFYNEGGRWISRSSLPPRYHGYDLYHSYKVVVNEPTPYRNDKMYREKYSSYKGRHDQEAIRDSHDPKYSAKRNHPERKGSAKQQKHDNGKRANRDGNDKPERK